MLRIIRKYIKLVPYNFSIFTTILNVAYIWKAMKVGAFIRVM